MTESPQAPTPFLRRVFQPNSWKFFWIPLFVTLGAMAVALTINPPGGWTPALLILFLAGVGYFLVSAIVWFAKKRVAAGFASLACLLVSGLGAVPAVIVALVLGMGMTDDFAKGLKLPEGVPLSSPAWRTIEDGEIPTIDTFQAALRAAVDETGGTDPLITTAIPSLGSMHKNHPLLLQQYLAAHPGWRVYLKRGAKHATRRWVVDGHWEMSLHGYYSEFDPTDKGTPRFQTRTNLGLSGKTWSRGAQKLPAGKAVAPTLSTGNSTMQKSYVFFDQDGIAVELFEEAETEERRMTKAAIAELEKELAPLAASPDWETARTLLPEGAILPVPPSFALFKTTGGGGIYNAEIRCNPGEPGRLLLKAWEITRNVRLSESRLNERGSEFVGWSDNPDEQFLSEVHFTIFEGDWEQYYGARFEVWFQPESGAAERKLLESNWKIEGWMR